MKYLSQGMESKKKIELMLSLTKTGENIRLAIVDHLVNNFPVGQAASLNGVKSNNLSVAISNLNKVAEVFEGLHELKMYEQNHTK